MDIHVTMKDKTGFDKRFMRTLYRIAYPFVHCACHVPESFISEEPMVFVTNHYEAFGPLASVISLPLHFRLWTNDEMLHPKEYVEKTAEGLKRAVPFLPMGFCRWVYGLVSPLVEKVFTNLNPVPIFRDEPSTLMTTLRTSVNYLTQGENLLIFPEEGLPRYSDGGVTPFFSGFAMVGELYRRKTGKELKFCPIYIDKRHRRIEFGEVMTYAQGNPTKETARISDGLHDQILEMAKNAGFDLSAEEARNAKRYPSGR